MRWDSLQFGSFELVSDPLSSDLLFVRFFLVYYISDARHRLGPCFAYVLFLLCIFDKPIIFHFLLLCLYKRTSTYVHVYLLSFAFIHIHIHIYLLHAIYAFCLYHFLHCSALLCLYYCRRLFIYLCSIDCPQSVLSWGGALYILHCLLFLLLEHENFT